MNRRAFITGAIAVQQLIDEGEEAIRRALVGPPMLGEEVSKPDP